MGITEIYKYILIGVAILALFIFLGLVGTNLIAYRSRKRNPEEEPVIEVLPVKSKAELPDLNQIHRDLRISHEAFQMVEKEVTLLDRTKEMTKVREAVFTDPVYDVVDEGIILEYPPSNPPDLKHLQVISRTYSERLYSLNMIPCERMYPEPMEVPWKIIFRFITDEVADELELKEVCSKTGLFYNNKEAQTFIYPKITKDGDDLIFDTTGCFLTPKKMEDGFALFSATFNKNYSMIREEGKNLYRMVDLKPRADRFFPFGEKVYGQESKFEELIRVGREKVKKANMEVVLAAEIEDPVIQLPTQVWATINDFVHAVVVGQTGSGKSTTLLSNILINAIVNRDVSSGKDIYYFADGKSGGDFDLPAKYLSKYPVAYKSTGSDPMIELANLFHMVWAEYLRRQDLFKKSREAGKLVRNIYEYREQVGELPRVWVIIDEFKAFLGDMDFEGLTKSYGSIPYMLVRLLAEARSFGFTFIFASQRFQQDSFPTALRSNLATILAHNLASSDQTVVGIEGMPQMAKGAFFLKLEGLTCPKTNASFIQSRMPYLGSTEEFKKLLDKYFEVQEHNNYDYDLIYNRGEAEDMEGASLTQKWQLIKKLFIADQGFKIKEQFVRDHKIDSVDISSFLTHPEFPNGIGFGILENKDELSEDIGVRNKKVIEKLKADLYLFFCDFPIPKGKGGGVVENWKDEELIPKNFVFISKTTFMKPLKKALSDFEEQIPNTWFYELLKDIQKDFDPDLTLMREKALKEEVIDLTLTKKFGKDKVPTVDTLIKEAEETAIDYQKAIDERLEQWAMKKAKKSEIDLMKAVDPEVLKNINKSDE